MSAGDAGCAARGPLKVRDGLEESTCTDGKEGGVVDTEVPRERYGVEEEWVAACGDVDSLAVLG